MLLKGPRKLNGSGTVRQDYNQALMAVTASASRELYDRADRASVKSSRLRQGPRGRKALLVRISGLRGSALAGTQHPVMAQRPPPHGNFSLSVTHTRARAHMGLPGRRRGKNRGEVGFGAASLWTRK